MPSSLHHRPFPCRLGGAALALLLPLGLAACASEEGAKTGGSGPDSLHVSAAFEGQPAVGQNELLVTVRDAEDKPVAGAKIAIDAQMPAHGHGSSEQAKVSDRGDGTYLAAPVTLQMKGAWRITVTADKGGDRGETTLDVTI